MWQNPLGIFSFYKYSFFFISISNNTYHDVRRQQKLPLNKLKKITNKEQKKLPYFTINYSTLYCSLATKVY